jgi:uncharacterized membrane protein
MSRRRSTPWIHRWSRLLIGAIAILGAVITGYITITHLQGQEVACPTTGCHVVLNSPFAKIGNLPLSLFGILAYVSMAVFALGPLAFSNSAQKDLRKNLEEWTWLLLLMGSIAMVVFSGYLMWLLFFKISAGLCIYCLASATFTVLMLLLTLFGREWPDIGQVFFSGIVVAMLAIVGTLMFYSSIESGIQAKADANKDPYAITTTSGTAEIALAKHLTSVDAKMYGAFWCPHCQDQKTLFGKEAFDKVQYFECDPKGPKAQPKACVDAKVESYPTWHVKDKVTTGTKALTELGKMSAYTGPQNFKNVIEGAIAPPPK